MSSFKPRPYQKLAKESVRHAYHNSGLRRVGLKLPTGTGKTKVGLDIAHDVVAGGKRVIWTVHLDTLVNQTLEEAYKFFSPEQVGVVKAERNQVDKPFIVASIQTLARERRLEQIIPPALTIVDEAHMSGAPSYRRYFEHVGAVPGGSGYLLGLTATWMRGDKRGLGDIWEKVVFKRSTRWAVRNGYLVEPVGIQYGPDGTGSHTDLDMSKVRIDKTSDDFNERDLQELVMVDDLRDTVIKGYLELAGGLPAALLAPTQASARYFIEGFNAAGIPAGEILASTNKATRAWNFAAYNAGTMSILGSCTALSVGWDSPKCAALLCVRPTRSQLLFIQSVGRVLRPWPGKKRGLIIDFVGVLDDAVLESAVDLDATPEPAEVQYPCPQCGRELCEECTGCPSMRCDYFTCTCEEEEDEFERVPIPRTAKKLTGVTEVDMFAGTDARWLTTTKGIPFVQTQAHTFFIYFDRQYDGYAVGRCGAKAIRCSCHGAGTRLATSMSSEDALEYGSELALAEDPSVANKKASWRQGEQPASSEQIKYAQRLGISGEGLSKAELSDQISMKIASGLLASVGS